MIETIQRLWSEAWQTGLWAASWSASVAGLTPQQAAWKPASGRNSIWQIVEHLMFWRGNAIRKSQTGQGPSDDAIRAGNFPEPADVSEAAWRRIVERFEESQRTVQQAIADGRLDLERAVHLLAHDCYHVGQINYLRAMQGLPPLE